MKSPAFFVLLDLFFPAPSTSTDSNRNSTKFRNRSNSWGVKRWVGNSWSSIVQSLVVLDRFIVAISIPSERDVDEQRRQQYRTAQTSNTNNKGTGQHSSQTRERDDYSSSGAESENIVITVATDNGAVFDKKRIPRSHDFEFFPKD